MTFTRHCDGCGRPESPPWVFSATITNPAGITVTTTATVPNGCAWKHVIETSELAQMGAAATMNRILTTKQQADEEVPF